MAGRQSTRSWLRTRLEQRNVSAAEVARTLDVTAKTVHEWLSGKARPRDEHAAALALLLDESEVEVRRRLGLWVPGEPMPAGSSPAPSGRDIDEELEELRAIRDQLTARIERLEGHARRTG